MLTWFHTRVQPHIDTKPDGFWYSLVFGTLLGSARNGDMIDWDTDMDIAVPQEKIAWLHKLLQDAAEKEEGLPRYTAKLNKYCGQVHHGTFHHVPCVPVLRLAMSAVNDAHIDIWGAVFDSEFQTVASQKITHPIKITNGAFPLQECPLGRGKFPCFAQKDKFLENWYGDVWNRARAPDHALLTTYQ